MKSLADCRLYTFIDTAYLGGRSAGVSARQLCDGGADLIQIRAKNATTGEVVRLVEEILPITQSAGIWCVLNDHAGLARDLGVPCTHLGQEDFFDHGRHHRIETLWPGAEPSSRPRLGLSTHSPQDAQRAVAAGADYLGVGPVFPTDTKPGRTAVTLSYVRWSANHLMIPWFAIGGINLGNVKQVIDAGARRICVVSAILNSADIAATTRAFRRELGE